MKLVFMSLTGHTRRFVNKFDYENYEIDPTNPFYEMNDDFVLVVPTYEREVTEIVEDFLETGNNIDLCRGVMGGGNRNFAELYIFTAKNLCEYYNLNLLYDFEFRGTDRDVENVDNIIKNLEGE